MCAFIEDIPGEEQLQEKLKKESKLIKDVFSKSSSESTDEFDSNQQTCIEWNQDKT